jgi:hypothetical protein
MSKEELISTYPSLWLYVIVIVALIMIAVIIRWLRFLRARTTWASLLGVIVAIILTSPFVQQIRVIHWQSTKVQEYVKSLAEEEFLVYGNKDLSSYAEDNSPIILISNGIPVRTAVSAFRLSEERSKVTAKKLEGLEKYGVEDSLEDVTLYLNDQE